MRQAPWSPTRQSPAPGTELGCDPGLGERRVLERVGVVVVEEGFRGHVGTPGQDTLGTSLSGAVPVRVTLLQLKWTSNSLGDKTTRPFVDYRRPSGERAFYDLL